MSFAPKTTEQKKDEGYGGAPAAEVKKPEPIIIAPALEKK